MIIYFRNVILLGALLVIGTGCQKKDDTETTENVTPENQQMVKRERAPQPQKNNESVLVRQQNEESIRKNGRILTADEQLKKYYAEKGIEYPSSPVQRDEHEPVRAIEPPIRRALPQTNGAQSVTEGDNMPTAQSVDSPESEIIAQQKDDTVKNLSNQPEYSDAEPPELLSVEFEPEEAQPGNKVTIVAQAVDNLSGIDSIFGVIQNPSATGEITFHCGVLRNDGKFVGYITLPPQAEAGIWTIKYMKLTDIVRNTKTYDSNVRMLLQAGLNVVNSDFDSIPPDLKGVYTEPQSAGGGDKIQIIVDAHDEKSGVYRVIGVLVSPSRKAKLSFSCTFLEEYSSFVGHVFIPNDAESGIWTIDYIRLEDNAANKKTFYRRNFEEMFAEAQVDVHSSGSDSQPPEIQSIFVYPPVTAYNEKLVISISVYDDVSGVDQVSGRIRSPSGKAFIPFFCQYNAEDGAYTATIIIQKNTEVGVWNIDSVLTVDKAKNRGNYTAHTTPQIEQATFEVAGE
ncbi:MAG: hypothetical protein H7A34_07415 [bacterium]|nr:hypothetical protein [bacterium]